MSSNRSVMNSVSSAHNQGVPSAEGPGHYSLKTGSHIVSDRITQQGAGLDKYSSPGRALPAGSNTSRASPGRLQRGIMKTPRTCADRHVVGNQHLVQQEVLAKHSRPQRHSMASTAHSSSSASSSGFTADMSDSSSSCSSHSPSSCSSRSSASPASSTASPARGLGRLAAVSQRMSHAPLCRTGPTLCRSSSMSTRNMSTRSAATCSGMSPAASPARNNSNRSLPELKNHGLSVRRSSTRRSLATQGSAKKLNTKFPSTKKLEPPEEGPEARLSLVLNEAWNTDFDAQSERPTPVAQAPVQQTKTSIVKAAKKIFSRASSAPSREAVVEAEGKILTEIFGWCFMSNKTEEKKVQKVETIPRPPPSKWKSAFSTSSDSESSPLFSAGRVTTYSAAADQSQEQARYIISPTASPRPEIFVPFRAKITLSEL